MNKWDNLFAQLSPEGLKAFEEANGIGPKAKKQKAVRKPTQKKDLYRNETKRMIAEEKKKKAE